MQAARKVKGSTHTREGANCFDKDDYLILAIWAVVRTIMVSVRSTLSDSLCTCCILLSTSCPDTSASMRSLPTAPDS